MSRLQRNRGYRLTVNDYVLPEFLDLQSQILAPLFQPAHIRVLVARALFVVNDIVSKTYAE